MTRLPRLSRAVLALVLAFVSALSQAPPGEASGPTCTTSSAGPNTVQVCLTAPAAGATVSGPTTVTATATVTAGTASVLTLTFLLDGSGLLTDPQSVFSFTWHTAHWVDGAHTLGAYAALSDGSTSSAQPTTESVILSNGVTSPPINTNSPTIATGTTPPPGQPKIVVALGDGAGGDTASSQVASQVTAMSPNLFLYLGDVYEQGAYEEFQDWYDPIYGALRSISNPTPGNHEWANYGLGANAAYEWYWNNLPTYYSFDTAGWHFISLNGNLSSSDQQTWLNNDLAAHAGACIIAYWHQPLYALSGAGDPSQQALWRPLANAHATLVLNGHEHNYERWKPMDASGTPSTTGMAEIVAGTGGHHSDQITSSDPRVITSVGGEYGALKLSLTPSAVGFQFVEVDGTVFDSGSLPCQGSGTLTGAVTDVAAGHPIGGASVSYTGSGPSGPVNGTTTANAAGQYSVSGLPATTLSVAASATGYSSQRATVTVGGASTTTQNFIYPPPVSGTVLDATSSQPISGAPVSYTGGSTASDPSGAFTLAGATPGTYTVTASPAGYVSQNQNVTVTSGTTATLRFLCSLARGSIGGTVTDAAVTRNLAGAVVSYSGGSTTTNAAGQFTLTNVAPGTYTVTTSPTGYVSQSQTAAVTAGSAATVNFALNPGTAPTPIFSDGLESGSLNSWTGPIGLIAQTGSVHAGVYAAEGNTTRGQTHAYKILASSYTSVYYRVYFNIKSQSSAFTLFGVQNSSVSSIARLYVTGTGQLLLTNDIAGLSWFGPLISRGSWHVGELHVAINGTSSTTEVWLDGTYLGALNQTTNLGTAAVNEIRMGELNSGLTYDVVFDDVVASTARIGLGPTAISGTVTDASSGQPISGATVGYSGGSTTTSPNGRYTLSSVAPGSYAVTAAAGGYTSQSATVSVAAGNTATGNFALSVAPGTIAGIVTDAATNQPISAAQVIYTSAGSSGSTSTNGSGQYSLTGLDAGTYTVTASTTGYASSSQSVTVSAGNTTSQNFALNAALGSITGQVSDASTGLAIAGATVSYSGGSSTANSAGQYSLANVAAGTYALTASASGYAIQNQSVTVAAGGTATQNFTLTPNPGTISGIVADAVTNAPLSGVAVTYVAGSTTSNAQGRYTFSNVAQGTFTLTASTPNYGSQSQTATVGAGASVTQNFGLAPNPATISGTVTDATSGQPIAGATVSYSGGSTSTNAQGQYTVTNVGEGSYAVTAAAANYAGQSETVSVGAGATVTQNFALVPNPGTVWGTVTDASTNQPVGGATVSFSGGSTTSNAEGIYSLSNVPEGVIAVTAAATGYGSQSSTLTMAAGGGATLNFALPPDPGTITGTVTDAATNLPLGGATISYGGGTATTNAHGQYTLAGVPEGTTSLTASAVYYTTQTQSIAVLPGGTSIGNFALTPNPGAITGTVTDTSTNQAISGATVSFSGGSVLTDSTGLYTLAGVQEGTYATTVTASGYAGQSQTVSVTPGTTRRQDFALVPDPGSISGTITDEVTGQPIGAASVSYSGGTTTTDGAGHFAFAGVAEGSYTVTGSAAGFATQREAVTVAPGSAMTVNLALIPNPGTISGTVADTGSGQAIGGATVSYSGGSATTNGSGQYSLTGVTEGTYAVTASAGGYGSQSQTATVGPGGTVNQNFTLVLSPGTIRGTITDANTNQAIAGATVTFGTGSTTTDASGHYSATNLPPATYTVSAGAAGFTTQSQIVPVSANATVTQNFALTPPPGAVFGTVVDASTNQPISGATVSYTGGSATTNAQGQYNLASVVEGSYTETASATNYASDSRPLVVGPGASVVQNFSLAPVPGRIGGTVSDASTAQPISGATLSYSGGSTATNAQGQFTLTSVSEGTYVISATAGGYIGQSQSVTVGPGALVTQNFSLTLNRGSIAGSVTDAVTTQPIPGATIALSGGGTATTDASGHYAFGDILPGSYTLTVSAANYAGRSQSVIVSAGTTVTQNFTLAPNPGTISGSVTDSSTSQPVSGAAVSYSGGSATTNAQGQYSLTGVLEGTYTVTASASGYSGSSQTITIGPGESAAQNFSLAPQPGSITGTVTDSVTRQALSGATVAYAGGSGITNASGQYSLANVAEGSYSVTASAGNYASVGQVVAVGAGATVTQNFALAPNPGTITGVVSDASTGLPLSGATVSYSGGSTSTNASGQYTLSAVTEGSYTVTTSAAGYGTQATTDSVGPGAVVTQNVALSQAPGSVTGTVTSAATALPVSGASVTYSGGSTTTNASGGYTLSNVPSGTYSVTVTATGYQAQSQALTVNPGGASTRNFVLGLALVFGDGFEGGSLSRWSSPVGLVAETSTVHTGAYAVEGNTTNGQTHAYKLLGAGYQELDYRIYFEVKSQSGSFTLMGVQASTVSLIAHLQMANNGKLQLVNDIGHGSTMGPAISLNTWHSLELHVIVNGTSSTIDVWFDGAAVASFASTSANLGTALVDEVRLGNLATGGTYDVVFDDVAVDTVRVGR